MAVVVLFKGISSLAVSGALFRNMQVRQCDQARKTLVFSSDSDAMELPVVVQLTSCLGMFGCLTCCYEWAVLKESKHTRKYRGVEAPPVLINGEWAK